MILLMIDDFKVGSLFKVEMLQVGQSEAGDKIQLTNDYYKIC